MLNGSSVGKNINKYSVDNQVKGGPAASTVVTGIVTVSAVTRHVHVAVSVAPSIA
jgi:hypothetical protein